MAGGNKLLEKAPVYKGNIGSNQNNESLGVGHSSSYIQS